MNGATALLYRSKAGVNLPSEGWSFITHGSNRELAAKTCSYTRFQRNGLLVRSGRVLRRKDWVNIGNLTAPDEYLTYCACRLDELMGVELRRTRFKVSPFFIGRKVRKSYQQAIQRSRQGKGARSISSKTKVHALVTRHNELINSKNWWVPVKGFQGIAPYPPMKAKRDLAVPLGWAKAYPGESPLARKS